MFSPVSADEGTSLWDPLRTAKYTGIHAMTLDKKEAVGASIVFVWYSLGDSNPCYRRERAAS